MMNENFNNVNHLVLNFYPDGYSIAVKLNEFPVFTSETILETAKISYEETSLLDYIENEELPPLLVEMIDCSPKLSQYKIWHNGCLILEVRDKTNLNRDENCVDSSESSKMANGSYFILLKPTNLSMLNDVLNLTGSNLWSDQDRLQLESQIVLLNSPPLFLEPDAEQLSDQNSQWLNPKFRNTYTRHKYKLPHTKLKNLCLPKTNSNYIRRDYNGGKSSRNNLYQDVPDSLLPPELTLQQYLATKRAKKKTFAAKHLARFHRFEKNLKRDINRLSYPK